MAALDPDTSARVATLVETWKHEPGALLPVLHAVQDALGYVPPAAVPLIAEGLNLSRAEVHGVISFYHYFRDTPPGRHTIHVCRAEACQSMDERALEAHAKTAARRRFPPDDRRRRVHARAGVLPRQLRVLARR